MNYNSTKNLLRTILIIAEIDIILRLLNQTKIALQEGQTIQTS